MTSDSYISYFTPGQMAPETLEFIFVKRQKLAERIESQIAKSVLSASKQHTLLLGPRGVGKSHLVALLYHRIKARADLHGKVALAWLAEEEWSVANLADFFLVILRALANEYRESPLNDQIAALRRLPRSEIRDAAGRAIREFVGDRVLFLLVENLEEIFRGLSHDEQWALRSYLSETPFATILATTPSLFAGVQKQTEAFYGFFQQTYLDELTADEATELLEKLAEWRNDDRLAAFLKTPVARERVQAVNDLAGGHPRVYLLFAHLLTQERLDELVTPFLELLDELTPYYQSRMQLLSPQQRKIIEFLCDSRGAVQVKAIAEDTLLEQRAVAAQLGELEKMSYVRKTPFGRESYYELREPLLRMVIELKRSHNREPLRLIVDFLRRWYSRTERRERLERMGEDAPLTQQYLRYALDLNRAIMDTPDLARAETLSPEYWKCRDTKDYKRAAEIAAEIIERKGTSVTSDDWVQYAFCLGEINQHKESLASYCRVIELDPNNAIAWNNRAYALNSLGQHEEALVMLAKAIELDPNDAIAWNNRAYALNSLGQHEEALVSITKSLESDPSNATAWHNRAYALNSLGQHEEALVSITKSLEIDPNNPGAWNNHAYDLNIQGRYEEALASITKSLESDPSNATAWHNRAYALSSLGQHEEALASITKSLEIDPDDTSAWSDRAFALNRLGRYEEALASLEKAYALDPKKGRIGLHQGRIFLHRRQWEEFIWAMTQYFDLGAGNPDSIRHGDSDFVVPSLWKAQFENESEKLTLLAGLYTAHDALADLGQGITDNIPALFDAEISQVRAEAWLAAWQAAGAGKPELEIPLRLLAAAVAWKAKPDVRALLALPIEERRILESLLPNATGKLL